MAGSRTLKLSILADVNNLTKGLNSSTKEVETFGDKITKFGKLAGAAFLAAGVAAAAFAVKFAKDAIVAGEAAATANARIQQINESMGLFGDSVNVVSDRLIKYAEETARATGIDTNSIKATQAKLLTFKELAATANDVGGQFDRATQAAIDLASAGFGAAETNAVQLGKALNDPIKGLTSLAKSGVTFTAAEKDRIKVLVESNRIGEAQADILKAIETQVGGTALATANATDKMKVGFQQVTERVGIALLPILEKFTNFLLEILFPAFEEYVLPVVQKLTAAFSDTDGGLGQRVTQLSNTLRKVFVPIWEGLVSAFDSVKTAIDNNKDSFKSFWEFVKYAAPLIGSVLGKALSVVGDLAEVVITVIAKVLGAIKPLINFAIDGINKVITGINLIKPGSDIAYIPKITSTPGSTSTGSLGNFSMSTGTIMASKLGGNTTTGSTTTTAGGSTTTTAGGSTGGGGGGGVATAAKVAASAAASSAGIPSNFDVGRFRMAENASMGTTINLTVTGAFDKEGTARTIVETLNNSFYRGTGGATNLQIA